MKADTHKTKQESTTKADTHKTEMSLEELSKVTGGGMIGVIAATFPKKTGTSTGGQNDAAQMFQQILQQLTQGG